LGVVSLKKQHQKKSQKIKGTSLILIGTMALSTVFSGIGTGLPTEHRGLKDIIGIQKVYAETMPNTPNNESLTEVWDKLKANNSNMFGTPVSSTYLTSVTREGVTQYYWQMKVLYSYSGHSSYGYFIYNNEYKAIPPYYTGSYYVWYDTSVMNFKDGVFWANNLYYNKYPWASEYRKQVVYDFFTGKDYTIEYIELVSTEPYQISTKTLNEDRILRISGKGYHTITRIDRNTGTQTTRSDIYFTNGEFENGVLIGNDIYAFVSSQNGYKLYIINLNDLSILNTISLNGYATLSTNMIPGYLVVKYSNGSGIALDTTNFQVDPQASAVINAAYLVQQAEQLKTQQSVDTARAAVNQLPDSQQKTDLINRLDAVQSAIDANNAAIAEATYLVGIAENTKAQSDIDAAQTKIDTLWNTPEKTALQQRLDVVKATVAVEKAETTLNQADVDAAQNAINLLSSSNTKTELQNRLNVVKNKIAAKAAVEQAIASKTLTDIMNAFNLVNALPDDQFKSDLSARLGNAVVDTASTLVTQAETQKTEEAITTARNVVTLLPDGQTKDALNQRLDTVQREVAIPTDNRAPNAPAITVQDNAVNITAADNGGIQSVFATTVDDFETATFKNPLTGDWVESAQQKYSGNYSLKSATIGHNSKTSEQVTFTVPQGTTGQISFNYLVRSESGFDFFKVYLNGSCILSTSGYGSWQTFTKTLTPGTYTLKFEYSKDGSVSQYDDAAYIDNLSITALVTKQHLPSGIQKIEYKINDGEWQVYNGPFTPSVGGQIKITARATDWAGNVGPETEQIVTIESNTLQQATDKVNQLETLVDNLAVQENITQENIDEAQTLLQEAQQLVEQLPDGNDKTALLNRITTARDAIVEAQNVFNAISKVRELETFINDLSTQSRVDQAQTILNEEQQLVNALKDGSIKTGLQNRIATVQVRIYEAQATIYTQTAENSCSDLTTYEAIKTAQTNKDIAVNYINEKLPDDNAVKTELMKRLEAVQLKIDEATATLKVQDAEKLIADLSTWEQCDKAQAAYNEALSYISKLPDGNNVKAELLNRMATVQLKIDTARATIKVQEAENATADLSTWDLCDKAQGTHDNAIPYINKLPEDNADRSVLQQRLDAVQLKIDVARATIKVETAENSIDQNDVDSAKPYIDKLPDGEIKTDLQNRLNYVQEVIDATNSVQNAESNLDKYNNALASSDLWVEGHKNETQLIDALQSQLDNLKAQYQEVLNQVNALGSTDKPALATRIEELNGRLAVIEGMENSIQQIINELAKNPNHAKGKYAETTVELHYKAKDGVTNVELKGKDYKGKDKHNIVEGNAVDLFAFFKDDIEQVIGLDNLHWLSIDQSIALVDQDGEITPVKDGTTKITVYNENGVVNIYVQLSGVPKNPASDKEKQQSTGILDNVLNLFDQF